MRFGKRADGALRGPHTLGRRCAAIDLRRIGENAGRRSIDLCATMPYDLYVGRRRGAALLIFAGGRALFKRARAHARTHARARTTPAGRWPETRETVTAENRH